MVSVSGFTEAAQHAERVVADSNVMEMCKVDPPPSGAPWPLSLQLSDLQLWYSDLLNEYVLPLIMR
jgi:hypothetical protein